jgi:iron-sulfur cluster assembly protein
LARAVLTALWEYHAERAMIQLTDNAVEAVKSALARSRQPAEGLRIRVETGGCAGLKYRMGLEARARDDDSVLRLNGVTLFVDAESRPHLTGMTVDFVDGLERAGFVFDNPNAASKCGCGKSFC